VSSKSSTASIITILLGTSTSKVLVFLTTVGTPELYKECIVAKYYHYPMHLEIYPVLLSLSIEMKNHLAELIIIY
jgi:hypothetical protein